MPPLRSTITGVAVLVCVALLRGTPVGTTEKPDWNSGDVFVGLGDPEAFRGIARFDPATGELVVDDDPATPRNEAELFSYLGTFRVLDAHGNFREDVAIGTRGVTAGCAIDATVDPLTGRSGGHLWALSFRENVVEQLDDLHDSRAGHRVLSAFDASRYGAWTTQSILVARSGDLYLGVADETVDYHAPAQKYRYDRFGSLLKFSRDGVKLAEYRVPVTTYPPGFRPLRDEGPSRGVDWFDVSAAGVLFYTSRDHFVRTWDLVRNQPGPGNPILVRQGTMSVSYPATPGIFAWVPDEQAHGIRLLPPGDGTTGGLLVATAEAVRRFSGTGRELAKFAVPATSGYLGISLSPDARHFWTGSVAGPAIMKFHLATGRPVNISPVPFQVPVAAGVMTTVYDRVRPPAAPYAICVKGEYTAQSVDCDVHALGPACHRVEACSLSAPGDDDGDGLDDAHDPDCAAPDAPFELCDAAGADEDANGLSNEVCQRENREGDTISFSLATPRASDEVVTFSASGLPWGVAIDRHTGEVRGRLSSTSSGTHTVAVTVERESAAGGVTRRSAAFTWIVMNVESGLPPVCTATASPAVIWPANGNMVPVTIGGIMDPDGDLPVVSIAGIEQSEAGAGSARAKTTVDAAIRNGTAYVRAEISGQSSARVYRIRYTAIDRTKASCSGEVFVVVAGGPGQTAIRPVTRWFNALGPS